MSQSVSPESRGVIYNIQRYNLHDGPGIRTIIFFKGCPLHCPWCANPESQSFAPERMGEDAVGYEVTAREAVDRAARDLAFFVRSAGGITLSGGEVVAQPDFARAVVEEAKNRGIHVTVETACCTDWDTFQWVTAQVDVILADIKLMEPKRHLEIVGMSNGGILENIRRSAAAGKKIIVRVPVIPGYNDDLENLRSTAEFCCKVGVEEMNLLPYHQLGVSKYAQLGWDYPLKSVRPPVRELLREQAEKLGIEYGLIIRVL